MQDVGFKFRIPHLFIHHNRENLYPLNYLTKKINWVMLRALVKTSNKEIIDKFSIKNASNFLSFKTLNAPFQKI